MAGSEQSPWPRRLTVAVFVLTVAQLAVATFVDGLPQFEGKGFGARLVAYPLMMLLVPACWVGYQRYQRHRGRPRESW